MNLTKHGYDYNASDNYPDWLFEVKKGTRAYGFIDTIEQAVEYAADAYDRLCKATTQKDEAYYSSVYEGIIETIPNHILSTRRDQLMSESQFEDIVTEYRFTRRHDMSI